MNERRGSGSETIPTGATNLRYKFATDRFWLGNAVSAVTLSSSSECKQPHKGWLRCHKKLSPRNLRQDSKGEHSRFPGFAFVCLGVEGADKRYCFE